MPQLDTITSRWHVATLRPSGWRVQGQLPDDPPGSADMHAETLPPRTPRPDVEGRLRLLDDRLTLLAQQIRMPVL